MLMLANAMLYGENVMLSYSDPSTLLAELKTNYKTARTSLRSSSSAGLMICKSRNKLIFNQVTYVHGKRKVKCITKNRELIYKLAHTAYLREFARRTKANMSLLERAGKSWQSTEYPEILRSLPKHYDMLDPALVQDPQRLTQTLSGPNPNRGEGLIPARLTPRTDEDPQAWFLKPYFENTSHLESKIHPAARGLSARSKSEVFIISIYNRLGYAFHYDETVIIGGYRVSPDFIGLRSDGSLIIHEHSGLWEDAYRERNRRKLELYMSAGFFPGENLLWTFDSTDGAIDPDLTEALIRNIFER